MAIWVGTSGYNYPEWRGSFYPEKFPTAKMLPYYAERFSTVEVNYTFYRTPNAKTIANWVAETPDGFAFTLKASRKITHDARLKNVGENLGYFLDTARGLGSKLGPILFQLPPSFRKSPDHVARLKGVLALLSEGVRPVFEFRHESWFDDEVYALLRERNAALCIADNESGTTPEVPTANFGYFRLRDEGYHTTDLRKWAETVKRLGAGWRETFVYFKHEESGIGPALAKEFEALLSA
jgi:uncharacterized protein YecE (DUF72 family)